MDGGQSLIVELEAVIQNGSTDRRLDTLRRITDLFVAEADRLNDQQIGMFDDVLNHLIRKIQGKALRELSRRLAPINNAPFGVVQRLAGDDDIAVAAPILTQSPRLDDSDLVELANTKSQAHLLAISSRARIGTNVTDVLLQRGDRDVFHKLAENSGARFSESGFAVLVNRSGRDEQLAEKVGLRADVPLHLCFANCWRAPPRTCGRGLSRQRHRESAVRSTTFSPLSPTRRRKRPAVRANRILPKRKRGSSGCKA